MYIGIMFCNKKKIKLIGDKSLSKRDFSRVIEPLNLFGVNIKSRNGILPLELKGSNLLKANKIF